MTMTLPDGEYEVVARRWALQDTEDKVGLVAIEFEATWVDGSTDTVIGRYSLNDSRELFRDQKTGAAVTSLDMTYQALRRLGWPGTDLSELNRIDPPKGVVRISVETKRKDDKYYTNVKILGDSDPRAYAMDDQQARIVAAKVAARFAAKDAKLGVGRAKPTAPARTEPKPQQRPNSPVKTAPTERHDSFSDPSDDLPF